MKILGIFLTVSVFLLSFSNVYEKSDYETEDEIIRIINSERTKLNLPELTRNHGMDLASQHHAIYLEKIRDILGKEKFEYDAKMDINGTPQGHFEIIDIPGFDELFSPTSRVSKYTKDSDSLSCECALFIESSSKNNSIDIVRGFKNSPKHWQALMMKDLLKYWGQPKESIDEIGICVRRVKTDNGYKNICVITTK